jgi:hypothetical protein
MTKDDALKLALEALEGLHRLHCGGLELHELNAIHKNHERAIATIKKALASPVQEPVAWQHKKPICDSQGKTRGYSDWKDGKGLAWWPHRSLYTTPLAQPPQRQPLTEREIELIDGMIEVQLHHAERCDRIANRVMAEKQKGWDMERVELLRKLKAAHGIKENA